jgi:hypothetical protein
MDRITHQPPRQQGYGSTSSLRNDSLKHTRKHERRGEGIESKNHTVSLGRTVRPGGADCSQRPRGQSGQVPRTVRKGHADRPAGGHGPSVKDNRTTRTDPRKTDHPQKPGGPSATEARTVREPAATKTQNQTGSKAKARKNTTNTRRTRSPRTVRHLPADRLRRTDGAENCSTPRVNSPNPSPDLPNGRSC